MKSDQPSEARERVLNVAERLFSERGYAPVTLKDIADALGMKQASLYYHVPGGKEALYVEVSERSFRRHRAGLEDAITSGGSEPREQLRGAARWILSQSIPDLGRMTNSDMPEIHEEHGRRLMQIAYESLLLPVAGIFQRAYESGEFRSREYVLLAGAFISVIASVQNLPDRFTRQPKTQMADTLIDLFLNGVVNR
jgi:AcrR family transcriptional regulator